MARTAARSPADPIAAEIFTAAFTGDPFFAWVFRDPETHVEALSIWWSWLIANGSEDVSLWRVGSSAAALWHPPNLRLGEGDQADLRPFVAMVAGLVGERLDETLAMFQLVLDAHPEGVYWYLAAVGSVPEFQGRGLGAEVLRPVLEVCDEEGLPAYLESSNPRNLAFYHRLGFAVTGEIISPDDEVSVTQMWRDPR